MPSSQTSATPSPAQGGRRPSGGSERDAGRDRVGTLRDLLSISEAINDETIAASLAEICRFADPTWQTQAARDSTLGIWLALNNTDLKSAMGHVLDAASSGLHKPAN